MQFQLGEICWNSLYEIFTFPLNTLKSYNETNILSLKAITPLPSPQTGNNYNVKFYTQHFYSLQTHNHLFRKV
jgi:hypothetical protein